MSFASGVADHYNSVEQKSLKERRQSSIIGVRDFNNAMKSYLIHLGVKYYLMNPANRFHLNILDLSCGKGGDLMKYNKLNASFVGGADIADVSIKQCKDRFEEMKRKANGRIFESKFVVADLTREDIKSQFSDTVFDIAFSQFAIHYSFETYNQALRYMTNAADNLKPSGFFIGAYPDGPKLVKLARENKNDDGSGTFTVDGLLEVKFNAQDLKEPKAFGSKYHFKLKEVVDCPEFLVHPKVLKKLFEHCGFYVMFEGSFEQLIKNTVDDKYDSRANFEKFVELFDHNYGVLRGCDEKKAKFDDDTWKIVSLYRYFICRKK